MIQFVDGDLLESDATIIVHQVNCRGVMGSGLAKQIKEKYPATFIKYVRLCNQHLFHSEQLLGRNLYTRENNNGKTIMIANLFAQDNYGYGIQQTSYPALQTCLNKLNEAANTLKAKGFPVKIGIPYNLSCGRGGGNWGVVLEIISKTLNAHNITIYRLR